MGREKEARGGGSYASESFESRREMCGNDLEPDAVCFPPLSGPYTVSEDSYFLLELGVTVQVPVLLHDFRESGD